MELETHTQDIQGEAKYDPEHDYYADLELTSQADSIAIRRSYAEIGRQCYRDLDRKSGSRDGIRARLRAIQKAFEVLGNSNTKAEYDSRRNQSSLAGPLRHQSDRRSALLAAVALPISLVTLNPILLALPLTDASQRQQDERRLRNLHLKDAAHGADSSTDVPKPEALSLRKERTVNEWRRVPHNSVQNNEKFASVSGAGRHHQRIVSQPIIETNVPKVASTVTMPSASKVDIQHSTTMADGFVQQSRPGLLEQHQRDGTQKEVSITRATDSGSYLSEESTARVYRAPMNAARPNLTLEELRHIFESPAEHGTFDMARKLTRKLNDDTNEEAARTIEASASNQRENRVLNVPLPPENVEDKLETRGKFLSRIAPGEEFPRAQWESVTKTARVKAQVEAENAAAQRQRREQDNKDEMERKRLPKVVSEEGRATREGHTAVGKETERLRTFYGIEPIPQYQDSETMPSIPTRSVEAAGGDSSPGVVGGAMPLSGLSERSVHVKTCLAAPRPTAGSHGLVPGRSRTGSPEAGEELRNGEPQSNRVRTGLVAFLWMCLRHAMRPSVRRGCERLEWVCTCGKPMYGDYVRSEGLAETGLVRVLKSRSLHFSARLPHLNCTSSSGAGSAIDGQQVRSNTEPSSSTSNSSKVVQQTGHKKEIQPSSSADGETKESEKVAIPTHSWMRSPAFFEVCVKRNKNLISLGEIPLVDGHGRTLVNSDIELFSRIKDRYDNLRRRGPFTFLFRPHDIHFVRFGVRRRGAHTGIYQSPLAIPPEVEVKEGRYHYHECPLDPLPPIDSRTFFHYFWEHASHATTTGNPAFDSLFMNRLPKKLGSSIFQQSDPGSLNLGWGVHIIEGLNKPLIAWLGTAILIISFMISVVYDLATKNKDSGFAIWQWVVAVLSTSLMATMYHLGDIV